VADGPWVDRPTPSATETEDAFEARLFWDVLSWRENWPNTGALLREKEAR